MIQILAVTGPTASGKTALALRLAELLGSEIISADSMQVYRGMEIGTAAPTPEEQARVRHHLVSFLPPDALYSAGEFERLARPLVEALNTQGKPAIVAGGSGLYLRALIDGLFPGPEKNDALRAQLHAEAETQGVAALYARLQAEDPEYASVIHANDLRRIVRALEVLELTGHPLSAQHREHRTQLQGYSCVQIALEHPREALYDRINRRVDAMFAAGFLDEVQRLLDAGYAAQLDRLRSLGYREAARHLLGECGLEEATEAMKQSTRRFAKRQLTWFRADPRIVWLSACPEQHIDALAEKALELL